MAVPVPEPVRAALAPMLEELAREIPDARWVPSENLHLTLVFLGDTDPDEVQAIIRTLRETLAAAPSFEVRLGKTGTFGGGRRPSVLWLGIESGVDTLSELADQVAEALRPDELGGAERPSHRPHLTLARGGPSDLRRRARERLATTIPAWRVEQVLLLRSHLGNGPARYEVLGRAPLEGR